jgi:glycosyltransferase involved in cell wall biosynthesis
MAERIVVVMPAFNAGKTLALTYRQLPRDIVETVIVVDDGSDDETVQIARQLDLTLFIHDRNRGYGANQKTCYREALRAGATIVAMVHPDYQYDPRLLPDIIRPIVDGKADVVLGSRFMGVSPVKQGMPWWKYLGNRALTRLENAAFGLRLAEFHTGYRAFRREVLESVPFALDSDRFLFDQEIIAQIVARGFRIAEIPVPTKYLPDSSSASFLQSVRYGLGVVWMLVRFRAHVGGLLSQRWLLPTRSGSARACAAAGLPLSATAARPSGALAEKADR